ncbi:hypothetical protein [Streptomyces sp. NBC_01518]|uniref:hypothetical protein n=1 Tax=Streptomyces sp. NBC_01518 TaxID=2903891 RepID=UPI00386A603F
MDQGIAAVLGALVGASSALGAGWMTARTQINATRISAQAEHRRQRRESRHTVYKDFINAYEEFGAVITPLIYFADGPRRDLFTEDAIRSVGDSLFPIQAAWLDVSLAGPESVSRKADQLIEIARLSLARVHEISYTYRGADDEESVQERVQECWDALFAIYNRDSILSFTEIAQTVLDDDGTQLKKARKREEVSACEVQ